MTTSVLIADYLSTLKLTWLDAVTLSVSNIFISYSCISLVYIEVGIFFKQL